MAGHRSKSNSGISKRTLTNPGPDGKRYRWAIRYEVKGGKWNAEKGCMERATKEERVPASMPNTAESARKLLAQRQHEQHTGGTFEAKKGSFRQLAAEWRETKAARIRPATLNLYDGLLATHILPAIGDTPIASVGLQAVQRIGNDALTNGRSPSTAKHMLRLVRAILAWAVKCGHLKTNPAADVEYPKQRATRRPRFLTADEVRRLIAVVPERYQQLFRVAVTTGMRLGEVLGSRWEQIDETGRVLKATHALGRDGQLVAPKTEEARRPVPLSASSLDAFAHQGRQQAADRLAADTFSNDLGLCFTKADGSPLDRRNVTRIMTKACKAAGIEHARFHDLRHTCATLALGAGASPKDVQRQLRHTDVLTTLRTYIHDDPDRLNEAADRVAAALAI